MKIRWSETALSELDDIFSYIQRNNRLAAIAVVERIEALSATLPMKRASVSSRSCAIRF